MDCSSPFGPIFDSFQVSDLDRQALASKHGIVDFLTLQEKRELVLNKTLDRLGDPVKDLLKHLVVYLEHLHREHPHVDGNDLVSSIEYEKFMAFVLLQPAVSRPVVIDVSSIDPSLEKISKEDESSLSSTGQAIPRHTARAKKRRHNYETTRAEETGANAMGMGQRDSSKEAVEQHPPQGFFPQEPSTFDEGTCDDKAEKFSDPDVVGFHGRQFAKGACYYIHQADTEEESDGIVVGIVSFHSNAEAKCIGIKPLSETILAQTIEGIDYSADFNMAIQESQFCPEKYVQWGVDIKHIHLSKLGRMCSSPKRIPDLIYEPQKAKSRMEFGYTLRGNEKNRMGCRHRKPRLVELFCGAGGMHQGFKHHGFETVCAVDKSPIAIETFKMNNPECADAAKCVDVNVHIQSATTEQPNRRAEHCHASPPCRGCSRVNRGGQHDDENNRLSLAFAEILKRERPLTGTFENVLGFWSKKGMPILIPTLISIVGMGYQFRLMQLNACDYGDPQLRPRLFIFVAKSFVPMPKRPVATHADPRRFSTCGPSDPSPWVTAGDVLTSVPPNEEDKPIKTKPGEHCSLQLEIDRPAPALRASGAPVFRFVESGMSQHQPKRIGDEEMKALMQFPSDYKFAGGMGQRRKQIGNAVSGNLARAVAGSIAEVLRFVYRGEEAVVPGQASGIQNTQAGPIEIVHLEDSDSESLELDVSDLEGDAPMIYSNGQVEPIEIMDLEDSDFDFLEGIASCSV